MAAASTPPASPVSEVRYEPPESPPRLLSAGLGLQLVILALGGIVITPLIIVRAAGGDETYLLWAVTMALVVSGITTVLQGRKFGRIGAGYVLLMGTSGAFIAVSITALAEGGPAMLATLVVVSSLFQFLLAWRLSLLRRILTPTVAGVVIMLIPVTVMSIVADILRDVPADAHVAAAPTCAAVSFVVITALAFLGRGALRLWAPVIGILAGVLVGGYFGIYDTARVAEAPWIGLPDFSAWPGFDLEFGATFWLLLPGFLFVTQIGAIETIGDAVAIQRVSWRKPRATDFRSVQGAVNADGMGNLLSGLAGTVPNTTYSSSISVTELTGVGARAVGVSAGVLLVLFAGFPKFLAAIIAIPGPVVAAYLTVILAALFVVGMKIALQGDIDYRQGMIAGISFWIGAGFQTGSLFPELFPEDVAALLHNGMTAGGLTAILLTAFVEAAQRGRKRLEVPFDVSALPKIQEFVRAFARRHGWRDDMVHRLDVASEETLLTLGSRPGVGAADDSGEGGEGSKRGLLIIARREGADAVLEFVAAGGDANIEDQLTMIDGQQPDPPAENLVSLRLLDHVASSVRHQQYHDIDVVTVRIQAAEGRSDWGGERTNPEDRLTSETKIPTPIGRVGDNMRRSGTTGHANGHNQGRYMQQQKVMSPELFELNGSVIFEGDSFHVLQHIPDNSIHCVVTSPPYWGLRDYNIKGQIGLEATLPRFINHLVAIFNEVKRVLREDGTLWLNIGDGYTSGNRGYRATDKKNPARAMTVRPDTPEGLKPKDLQGIPWRLAFALQDDGWYLRSDIVWHKPNAMPESVKDRPTRAHEYLFMLTKSERYYYDYESVKEQGSNGKLRNRRSIWSINTQAFSEAHFATFPTSLIEPCVLASTKPDDYVLDPFFGSGTVGVVCAKHHRRYVGIELHPEYVSMAARRLSAKQKVIKLAV